MVDNGHGQTFHPGSDKVRSRFYARAKWSGIDLNDTELSRYKREDRLIVAKYGCGRCPHRNKPTCPYLVGSRKLIEKPYVCEEGESMRNIEQKDAVRIVSEAKDQMQRSGLEYGSSSDGVRVLDSEFSVHPDKSYAIVSNDVHPDGICPERIKEMAFWGKQVGSMSGLLAERAESMLELKEMKDKILSLAKTLPDEDMTFKTVDGDLKVKTILVQAQDVVNKYNQLIEVAINQTLKYDELKMREREGPKVIDVSEVEKHLKKLSSAKVVVDDADNKRMKQTSAEQPKPIVSDSNANASIDISEEVTKQ